MTDGNSWLWELNQMFGNGKKIDLLNGNFKGFFDT